MLSFFQQRVPHNNKTEFVYHLKAYRNKDDKHPDLFDYRLQFLSLIHICGNNDKEQVYGAPEYLFKNDSQVDKWLNEKTQKKFKSRDEVWKEYLAQNPTLNSNWLGG